MKRSSDPDNRKRRVPAPSIHWSMLPHAPEFEPPPGDEAPQSRLDPDAPPPPDARPSQGARSPYRGRANDGRTLQPFDLPEPGSATPAPARGRAGGPTLTLPEDELAVIDREPPRRALPPFNPEPPGAEPPPRPTPAPTVRLTQAPPLPPAPPMTAAHHRAVLPTPGTADRAPLREEISRDVAAADPFSTPVADRHNTLISQPPDAQFFALSAPIEHDQAEEEVDAWERRRLFGQFLMFIVAAVILSVLLALAAAFLYTMADQMAFGPRLTP